jgi:hypothetical protein
VLFGRKKMHFWRFWCFGSSYLEFWLARVMFSGLIYFQINKFVFDGPLQSYYHTHNGDASTKS